MITNTFRQFGKGGSLAAPGRQFVAAIGSAPKPNVRVVYTVPTQTTTGAGRGHKPPPPVITFKTPQLPAEAYNGPSLTQLFTNWWWGSTPKVEVEVSKEKAESEIDVSNCLKQFLLAVALVAKSLWEAAQAQADAKKDKQGDGDASSSTPEPMGVTQKKATDDLKKARQDFASCLQKGRSNFDAFRDICESEAKSLAESVIKEPGKARTSVSLFQKTITTLADTQNREIARIRAEQDQFVVEIQKEVDQFNTAIATAHAQLTKHKNALAGIFTGATKAYTDVVKDSDGLTRVLASVVKAIEKCCAQPDEANIAAVSKALKAQVAEVSKGVEKGNKAQAKAAKAFEEAIEAFEKKWV